MNNEKVIVYPILLYGRENAISLETLSARLGMGKRAVIRQVNQERAAGYLILSNMGKQHGYYRSNDRQEIKQFLKSNQKRQATTARASRAAREALKQCEGQLDIGEEKTGFSD